MKYPEFARGGEVDTYFLYCILLSISTALADQFCLEQSTLVMPFLVDKFAGNCTLYITSGHSITYVANLSQGKIAL